MSTKGCKTKKLCPRLVIGQFPPTHFIPHFIPQFEGLQLGDMIGAISHGRGHIDWATLENFT